MNHQLVSPIIIFDDVTAMIAHSNRNLSHGLCLARLTFIFMVPAMPPKLSPKMTHLTMTHNCSNFLNFHYHGWLDF
jgi:hypothetical protein